MHPVFQPLFYKNPQKHFLVEVLVATIAGLIATWFANIWDPNFSLMLEEK